MMGIAEPNASTTTITANTLPILPRSVPGPTPGGIRCGGRGDSATVLQYHLIRLRLKREIHGFGFAAGDRHILRLRTVIFLPGGDGVFAGREIGQGEGSIVAGDRIVRGLQHSEVTVHPGMN